MTQLWPDSAVEEGSLTRAVFTLRKVLGDGKDGQQYIATVPKRGYRFIAPVALVEKKSPPPTPVASAPSSRLRNVVLAGALA